MPRAAAQKTGVKKTARQRLSAWLNANRKRFETNAAFAKEVECSEGRISQILAGAVPSPKLAVRIAEVTAGAIPSVAWFENLSSATAERRR